MQHSLHSNAFPPAPSITPASTDAQIRCKIGKIYKKQTSRTGSMAELLRRTRRHEGTAETEASRGGRQCGGDEATQAVTDKQTPPPYVDEL